MGWVLEFGTRPVRVGKDDRMGLKIYEYMGGTYQFTEGKQPEGAVLVEAKQRPAPTNKARRKPANKARRKPANKGGTGESRTGQRTRGRKRASTPADE
jgi:hypothetical protein